MNFMYNKVLYINNKIKLTFEMRLFDKELIIMMLLIKLEVNRYIYNLFNFKYG